MSSITRAAGSGVSTPAKQVKSSPVIESPGTWRHPRFDEIVRRRQKCTFTDANLQQIGQGLVWLIALWATNWVCRRVLNPEFFNQYIRTAASYAYIGLQLIPILSIFFAILPLIRPDDDLSDIPLTSAQRKLLGLPPSSVPPTPDAKYHTPPRYSRTPSLAGSAASNKSASYASSPLSGRGSPLPASGSGLRNSGGGATAGSPFSPRSGGSPLGIKGFNPTFNNGNRRSSLGSPSPLGVLGGGNGTGSGNGNMSLFSDVPSPSPTSGKRASVGLNSKWLYEKGRRSSGSGWMQ